jgi:tripartite-type tricarboxylate transporter receptor subunit TctC
MGFKSVIAGGAMALAATGAFAQDYPNRAVTVIVPFAAGGPTDVAARIYGEFFSRTLGQQFVVENAAGAGGTTGALRAARSKPDGYTVFVHNVAPHVSGPVLYPSATYDPIKNFVPIGTLAYAAHYVVVRKDFPAKDLKSFIDYARANPTKINYGSAGAGSATHLACVLFGQQTGAQITHVPYRGTGPALNDLVAGTLDMMCDQGLNMMGQATAGTVNVLAIAQKTRFAGLPNVPTTAEAGLPGFEVQAATAMYAIAGTPEPIVKKLVETMAAAYKDEGVRKRIQDLASELPSNGQDTPAGLAALTKAEFDRWEGAIKAGNIKVQ